MLAYTTRPGSDGAASGVEALGSADVDTGVLDTATEPVGSVEPHPARAIIAADARSDVAIRNLEVFITCPVLGPTTAVGFTVVYAHRA
ncbi:hypothetical protein GSI01S_42_00190 [Gordonia sihwensis NBRC 108236]|uniref:Uncharacterized protein n=2 Tax=Gordonia TaxID=2053 RepID=L7LNP5_9ACTN|nr:hypothetical protein GSI01S_42_00190 [Gordonia sihwensis NBRC 108236]